MHLRTYVQQVPAVDGRIPLLPARPHTPTTRWVVPERDGWYLYCEAYRVDTFPIPDTIHAACLPHHLAPYDPVVVAQTWDPPPPPSGLDRYTQTRMAEKAAQKQRLLDAADAAATTRLTEWLATGATTVQWELLDTDDDTDYTAPHGD